MTDNLIWILIAVAAVQVLATFLILHSVSTLRTSGGGGAIGTERAAAFKLAEQARAVYAKAVTLPPTLLGPGGDRQLRLATLWTADEVAALRPAGPLLSAACGEIFTSTEGALGWLFAQATAIREKPAGQGAHLVDFPHEKWKTSYEDALDGLHLLETYGEVTAKMAELAR